MITKKQKQFIKIKLIKKNMKQVDLARLLGRHRQQVNNVINGILENLILEEQILDFVGWYDKEKKEIKRC